MPDALLNMSSVGYLCDTVSFLECSYGNYSEWNAHIQSFKGWERTMMIMHQICRIRYKRRSWCKMLIDTPVDGEGLLILHPKHSEKLFYTGIQEFSK